MLTAVEPLGRRLNGRLFWRFRCDCGREHDADAASIRHRGGSCGCARADGVRATTSLGGLATQFKAEYSAWYDMVARCTDPEHEQFRNYGARGITVCEPWLRFDAFLSDMGPRPSPDLSLDRRENDRGYGPDNCRWTTQTRQCRNTRRTRFVRIGGREMSFMDACELTSVRPTTAAKRLSLDWTEDQAFGLSPPPRRTNNRHHR